MDVLIDLRDKIRVQDMAAGYLLIKESGGLIVDADSQPLDSDFKTITRLSFIGASNQVTLDKIMFEMKK
jgi:myo-inositol-1(or 4)-monophosphatase